MLRDLLSTPDLSGMQGDMRFVIINQMQKACVKQGKL